jgi:hypothetical protein
MGELNLAFDNKMFSVCQEKKSASPRGRLNEIRYERLLPPGDGNRDA